VALFNFDFGKKLLNVFSKDKLTDDSWNQIYETLIQADLGPATTELIITKLKKHNEIKNITEVEQAKDVLSKILIEILEIDAKPAGLNITQDGLSVFLIVGVNGTGKTTSVGKLAQMFSLTKKRVVLAAADTFRAAAANQLATWATRSGVELVQGEENAEPASVAFTAVKKALAEKADILLVDTAGRLHTKSTLMDELEKIKRVIEKQNPVNEVLLVIDATTGQNGLVQAKIFTEAVAVTGVILTKLDGSAKGGIVVAIANELGVPVKFVGFGETIADLKPFKASEFARDLLN
jgi:fused signal recognition particle receptor